MADEFPERPWWGILSAPRATIRAIVDVDPARWVWPLIVLAGVPVGLIGLVDGSHGVAGPLWAQVLGAAAGGAFRNVVGVVVFAYAVDRVAHWLGGSGTRAGTRAAMAWSGMPTILSLLLWLPLILTGSPALPAGEQEVESSRQVAVLLVLFGTMAAGLWALVLTVTTVAEVQRLSILRSIGALAVSTGLFLLALVVLWWVAMLAASVALLPKFRWF